MALSSTNTGERMKIDNTPTAIVICVGIVAGAALVAFLAAAGWQTETIIGFVTLLVGVLAGQIVNARKSATIEAKTDQQTQQLAAISDATDGGMRAAIADAVEAGIARAVAALRAEKAGQ